MLGHLREGGLGQDSVTHPLVFLLRLQQGALSLTLAVGLGATPSPGLWHLGPQDP